MQQALLQTALLPACEASSLQGTPPETTEFASRCCNRTTPSYVAFTDTERLIGDAAKNQVGQGLGFICTSHTACAA